jgi:HSP20 family molecular chaperone IbpA
VASIDGVDDDAVERVRAYLDGLSREAFRAGIGDRAAAVRDGHETFLCRRPTRNETKPRPTRFDIMTRSHRDDEDEQDEPEEERSGTRIDVNISVTDLLSDLLDGRRSETSRRTPGRRPRGRPTRRGHASGDEPAADESADDDYRVESVRDGDELTVVADLLGADPDDVTAGIDPERSELVVATGGRVVGRVSLPWDPVEIVETSFNNGVLQVRLRPAAGD